MSAGAPAIPAPGPFPGSHAPPIGQLRVARRPNRPPRSLSESWARDYEVSEPSGTP